MSERVSLSLAFVGMALAACAQSTGSGESISVMQVAGKADHACALRSDGKVRCWGGHLNVLLGVDADAGVAASSVTPVEVPGVAGAVEIAVADEYACARDASGAVRCWGSLPGAGATPAPPSPPTLVEGITDAVQISVGPGVSCVRRHDGTVGCWGDNFDGNLGDGTTIGRSTPQPVVGLDHVTDVSAGDSVVCAAREDGSAWCWGRGIEGQLGSGPSAPDMCPLGGGTPEPCALRPVQVVGLDDVQKVSAGLNAACALRRSGEVACWGWNSTGEVGDGTTTDRDTPVTIPGLSAQTQIYRGYLQTCAVGGDDVGRCWGARTDVDAPDGGVPPVVTVLTPTPVAGLMMPAQQFTGGWYFTCALAAGRVWCWGQYGGLDTARVTSPTEILGL